MTISNKNFSNFAPGTIPQDVEYVSCNFTQFVPDTSGANPEGVDGFPGYSGPTMTFRNCNLVNFKVPAGSTVIDSNTIVKEFFANDVVETITVDGLVVHSRQRTKTVIYGQWNPETESYEYLPVPVEEPNP